QIQFDQWQRTALGVSVGHDDDQFERRLVAGKSFSSDRGFDVLVSEYLLYRLGIADDAAIDKVIGKKIRLSYLPASRSALSRLETLGLNLDAASVEEAHLLETLIDKA